VADLRDYVLRGQTLLQGLREQPATAGAAPVGVEELAQAGAQLLQRLGPPDDGRP